MSERLLEPIREFFSAVSVIAALITDGCTPPPSDAEMIETLQRNRSQFELLRETMCGLPEGQIVMMHPEWSKPPISEEQKEWYYAVLQNIGAVGVQANPEPCGLWIEVWSVGLGGSGDYKKYRFGDPVHEPMIESANLDTVDRASSEIAFYHRRIDADWWLEFDHWP